MPIRIRKADAKDAAGIARVHIETWRTSYREIVRSDFHRKGVGRSLVEAVELQANVKGFKALEVSTGAATVNYEPYDLTRKFYHAIAFADVSVEPKGFPSGDDKLLLRKLLSKNE